MEDDLSGIDFDSIDENDGDFKPLPCGDYDVKIIGAFVRENRNRNGTHLAITLEVVAGDHRGRRIWDNLNLSNKNPDAARIGKVRLKRLVKACGLDGVKSSAELLGRQLSILLGQRLRSNNGELGNVIKVFSPLVKPAKSIAKPAANGATVPSFLKG